MGITTQCLNAIPAIMAGSYSFEPGSGYIAIGISGLAFASGNTTLGSETDRNAISSSDLSTPEQITFTADWSATEMSGTILKEFGTITVGSALMNREVLTGSQVFDGEQELQIQQTFKFYI